MAGSKNERGEAIRREAEASFGVRSPSFAPGVLADIFECVAMMGVGVSQNIWTPREDGTRVDVRLEPWPTEALMVDPTTRALKALTSDGPVDVVHGDGKWVVTQLHHTNPWRWGAIVALAMAWPDRAYGIRDRSQNAETHGQGKPIGTLPENVTIDSPEGRMFVTQMRRLQHARSGMLKPYGTTLEYLESSSSAWQIFREIIGSNNSDIAKILLGQDGTVNNSGGNYIKSDVLFGVRNDIVEGDLRAMESALTLGTLRPWTALNFGRLDAYPMVEWLMPDADEDARAESLGKRTAAFNDAVDTYRKNGFVVDQPVIDRIASEFGIVPPVLEEKAPTGAEIFGYEVEGGVYTINELRRRKGEPPVEWGDKTVPERRAELAAKYGQQESTG